MLADSLHHVNRQIKQRYSSQEEVVKLNCTVNNSQDNQAWNISIMVVNQSIYLIADVQMRIQYLQL